MLFCFYFYFSVYVICILLLVQFLSWFLCVSQRLAESAEDADLYHEYNASMQVSDSPPPTPRVSFINVRTKRLCVSCQAHVRMSQSEGCVKLCVKNKQTSHQSGECAQLHSSCLTQYYEIKKYPNSMKNMKILPHSIF